MGSAKPCKDAPNLAKQRAHQWVKPFQGEHRVFLEDMAWKHGVAFDERCLWLIPLLKTGLPLFI